MRKVLSLPFFLASFIPFLLHAQGQPSAAYFKNLINKNASLIGIAQNDLSNWRVTDAYTDKQTNVTFVYLQQTYLGIDIDKAINSLSFKSEKFATGSFEPIKNLKPLSKNASPAIDAKTALLSAAGNVNAKLSGGIVPLSIATESHTYMFDKLGISFDKIPVKLLWVRDDENNLKLVWQTTIHSYDHNALWEINVDASTGKVFNKTNLTVYEQASGHINKPHAIFVLEDGDQQSSVNSEKGLKDINSAKYNVIAYPSASPLTASPGLETNPWTRNHNQNANTLKWNNDSTTDYKNVRGNNVYVQQDLDSNDATTGYSVVSTTNPPDLTFNFDFDPNADPTEDPSFGETNLFYWDNLMHDLSYQYGFDEAAGNFQESNLGRGGKGSDFVYADAQDGGGKGNHIDNANMSTPADGSNPRQQMYLWYPNLLKTFFINTPVNFKGGKPAREGNVSNKNLLNVKGPITADIIIFKDNTHPDSSTGCVPPANAAELAGKIAYMDRGSCNFTVKYHNAQTAGAVAIVVGNVAPNDPRYQGSGSNPGNALVTMSATPLDNTITIPGVFIQYDTAKKIKNYGSGNVNATLQYAPDIDGELDNTIPTHEYTHGISNRLIGGPQNVTCLQNAEQMGEGWSDWYALMITENWATATITGDHYRTIGSYAAGEDSDIFGIRTYPYSTNLSIDPWTYDSLKAFHGTITNPADPHSIGEIWSSMLWDMTWNLIQDHGISQNIFDATGSGGNVIALSLITEAFKLTKCSPGFVDGRNAILAADTLLYGGAHSMEIWKAFAKRGLGYSASQGVATNTNDGVPAYDLPSVLAIVIGSFTAEKQGTSAALLRWTTIQEFNTDKFIIERSTDGRTFTSIGEVKAAGNSSVERSYQFADVSPAKGNNIYRIKEVDKDGKFNLSDLRSLNFADLRPSIKISPNPATNIVTISIPGNRQNITVRLVSNVGQLIGSYTMTNESYTIDVSKLAAGVYNINIDGNGYLVKYKLVIQ